MAPWPPGPEHPGPAPKGGISKDFQGFPQDFRARLSAGFQLSARFWLGFGFDFDSI